MSSTLHRILINTALTVPPSRIVLNNQEYLTAPAVLVVAGVLNGSLLPSEELHAEDWNGVVVTIGHPLDAAGTPLSARQPSVIATHGVGRVYHARLSTGQRQGHAVTSLLAELWINLADVAACGSEAQQAVEMIESQTPLEISTAFYCESESTRGSFYNTPYSEIARNLRPDHLALLPNMTGACSWADGCGSPRLNQQGTYDAPCACETCTERTSMEMPSPTTWQAFVAAMQRLFVQEPKPEPEPTPEPSPTPTLVTARTDQDTREAIYSALALEMGQDFTPIYVDTIDTATQSFTYRQGERLRQRSWQMDGEVLQLVDDAQDVQRSTTYVPVTSPPVTQQQQEVPPPMTTPQSSPVAIKARVNALIANAQSGWTERDRAMLEGMSEAALIRLEAQPTHVPAILVPVPEPPKTMEEAIALLPMQLQETMTEAAEDMRNRKQAAVAVLIANAGCPFEQDELAEMSVKKLEKLVAMAAGVSYAGKGLPAPRHVPESQEAPPPAPDTLGKVVERQKNIGTR